MSKGQIKDLLVRIKPSDKLISFIASLTDKDEMPENVYKIFQMYSGDTSKKTILTEEVPKPILTKSEIEILKELNSSSSGDASKVEADLSKLIDSDYSEDEEEEISDIEENKENLSKTQAKKLKEKQKQRKKSKLALNLNDIKWLSLVLKEKRSKNDSFQIYLHQLLEESKIVLPKNEIIERNPVLEARCVRLRLEQDARQYNAMTKNVDTRRKNFPEDTISYQLSQINRQLIAVLQFVFSVAAGFAFGFIGVELMVGNLDFGFRLLLGIIIALVIALAEIYFLAKKLNEDYDLSVAPEKLITTPPPGAKSNEKPHKD